MKVNGNKLIKLCGIAVCMALLFPFGGCGGSRIWYEVGYGAKVPFSTYMGWGEETIKTPLVICSSEELETACCATFYKRYKENALTVAAVLLFEIPAEDLEPVYYLKELTEDYDENFFINNALVLYFVSEEQNITPTLKKITLKNRVLTLGFTNIATYTIISYNYKWLFIIEIKRDDALNINEIAIKKQTKYTNKIVGGYY